MKTFGKRLKELREKCNKEDHGSLSQSQLANELSEELGISISMQRVSQWESGTNIHKDDRPLLVAIIRVLNAWRGIKTLWDADHLLWLGNYRSLDKAEARSINPGWVTVHQFATYFNMLIQDRTEHFVGRSHVFRQINMFLDTQAKGYFTLVGDPGIGKSTILAKYVTDRDCIFHFNIRSDGINTTSQFLKSVCHQLIDKYELPYAALPPEADQDGSFFNHLLQEAKSALEEDERIIIVVDALDEVHDGEAVSGQNLLYLPANMPDHVYFILSRRDVQIPLVVNVPYIEKNLKEFSEHNHDDIEQYIVDAAEKPKMKNWLNKREILVDEFTAALAAKSDDNFMYLRNIVYAILDGLYEDASLEELPHGLKAYYGDHWRRMGMTTRPLPHDKLKVIYILSVVPEPISREMTADFSGLSEAALLAILEEWRQFLNWRQIDSEMRYSMYHDSFREFLHRKEIVQAAETDLNELNVSLARNVLGDMGISI